MLAPSCHKCRSGIFQNGQSSLVNMRAKPLVSKSKLALALFSTSKRSYIISLERQAPVPPRLTRDIDSFLNENILRTKARRPLSNAMLFYEDYAMHAERQSPEITSEDPVDDALAWHQGDPRATIATLIEDCRHLRQQLALTEGAMSRGMTRGWTPSFDRSE